jgi:pantetheine-phosphate adenylyltransferase
MYPGTFDPLTNGHHELVLRAAELFDQVVVAVAESPGKTPIFSFEERMDMARQVLSEIKNVSVDGYAGLTVDYAREHEVNLIVRGLRAATDFEYEFQLASMNRHLQPGIETVFLTSTDEYNFLSSSLVREVASLGGDVSKFIHPKVGRMLRKRFQNN